MKVQTQRVVLTGYKFIGVSYFYYIILFLDVYVAIAKEQNLIIAFPGEWIKIWFVSVFKLLYYGRPESQWDSRDILYYNMILYNVGIIFREE